MWYCTHKRWTTQILWNGNVQDNKTHFHSFVELKSINTSRTSGVIFSIQQNEHVKPINKLVCVDFSSQT